MIDLFLSLNIRFQVTLIVCTIALIGATILTIDNEIQLRKEEKRQKEWNELIKKQKRKWKKQRSKVNQE